MQSKRNRRSWLGASGQFAAVDFLDAMKNRRASDTEWLGYPFLGPKLFQNCELARLKMLSRRNADFFWPDFVKGFAAKAPQALKVLGDVEIKKAHAGSVGLEVFPG